MPNVRTLVAATMGAALVLGASTVLAQSYPVKPVRIIVAYPPGQGTDIATRHMGEQLGRALGQTFIVENRPGAGGNVGTEATARAAPDGYTLTMGTTATHAANQFMYASVGYDPEKDFEPIALIGMLPMVISANPSFAATNIQQLIAASKAKPDTINVALTSTTARVVFELLRQQGGAPLFGVPYRGSGPAMIDVMGGQLPLTIDTVTATRPQVNAGKLRALAITSLKSSELLPGVASVAEQGLPGFEITAWNALFAPRGTPPAVITLLNAEVAKALALPETRQRLIQIGFEPAAPATPQQLGDFVRAERQKWGDIIRTGQIKAE
jgi:tripartite-type tricarboxylate transporter receptor subunit TctC